MPKKRESWSAIGRRKSSVARVQMVRGKGTFIVNKCPIDNYFGRDTLTIQVYGLQWPLLLSLVFFSLDTLALR